MYFHGGLDTLDGSTGIDTADFSPFAAAVLVSLNASGVEAYTQDRQTLDGGTFRELADLSGIENIVGTNFDDLLAGTAAVNNRLEGGAGNDQLYVHGGLDTLDGGAGTDIADFSPFASAVLVSLNASGAEAHTQDQPTLAGGTFRALADLSGIEHLVGTDFDDLLAGTAAVNNRLEGGAGNDQLDVHGGLDTLDGGAGTDTADFSTFQSAILVSLLSSEFEAAPFKPAANTAGYFQAGSDVNYIALTTEFDSDARMRLK